jgi:hypothetical protein
MNPVTIIPIVNVEPENQDAPSDCLESQCRVRAEWGHQFDSTLVEWRMCSVIEGKVYGDH